MDRYWLLTWTTYGTWLPGDRRGFVSPVRDECGVELVHNVPGTPYDSDLVSLEGFARSEMKGPPIHLRRDHADAMLPRLRETAEYRNWKLCAVGIMPNHVHIVVGVSGDPQPSDILRDFKSYASRTLNRQWSKPANGTWWTESGSKRKLPNQTAVLAAIQYVKQQSNPLVVWVAGDNADGGDSSPE